MLGVAPGVAVLQPAGSWEAGAAVAVAAPPAPIELLSPFNKRPEAGRDDYLDKRYTLIDLRIDYTKPADPPPALRRCGMGERAARSAHY